MANCIFAYPDRTISAASISGGQWDGLARLQERDRASKAQSADLTLNSTQFVVDLGDVKDIRVIALLDHNASTSAQLKVTLSDDINFSNVLYTSGWVPFWLAHFPMGGLPWGHPDLWTGGLISDEDYESFPKCRYMVVTDEWALRVRYIKVEIDDQTNPAGFFEVSRCLAAPGWQPPINMSYGAAMGWDDSATTKSSTRAGADYYGVLPKRRVCSFTIDSTVAIGVAWMMEMQRKLGVSQELFFVFDPDDNTELERARSFLSNMEKLSPLQYPFFDRNSVAYQLKEKIV